MTAKKIFNYGKYSYDYKLLRLDRKSLSLTILPDLSIVVRSPLLAKAERIEKFLQKKWLWIEKQLKYFKKYQSVKVKKDYVSGESFLYLGRQYKLIVRVAKVDSVTLSKGVILCYTTDVTKNRVTIRKQVKRWFLERTKAVFNERYNEVFKRFDYDVQPRLIIKKMDKRWGSFISHKSIILNPLLIRASKDCIDYVITHELCHLQYKNHSKKFHALLNKKYPGWEKVKEKLELRFT